MRCNSHRNLQNLYSAPFSDYMGMDDRPSETVNPAHEYLVDDHTLPTTSARMAAALGAIMVKMSPILEVVTM